MPEKNISEQLLAYLNSQREASGAKGTLKYYVDHYLENGHGTELEAELAFLEMQENPEPSQLTRNDAVEKSIYSSAISAKKAARSKQGVNQGATAENTVRKPKK